MKVWNSQEEEFLKKLSIIINQQSILYKKHYFKKNLTLHKFRIPIIIISSLNGLSSMILTHFMEQIYVSMFNAIISIIISIISSIEIFLKISDEMNKALVCSYDLNKLYLEIVKMLSLPVDDRDIDGINFVNSIYQRYLEIINDAPLIRKKEFNLNIENLNFELVKSNSKMSDSSDESKEIVV